jgi:hypothetical protein
MQALTDLGRRAKLCKLSQSREMVLTEAIRRYIKSQLSNSL